MTPQEKRNNPLPQTPEEIGSYLLGIGLAPDEVSSLFKEIGKQSKGTVPEPILIVEQILAEFIGNHKSIIELKHKTRILARAMNNDPVLILGETGTGKEIIARALHGDRKGYFIAVNCTSMPDELLESELFGHEPGAFTGANPKGRVGKFEAAKDGTLFLDEIGDMPLNMQSKLLRVLQDKKICRLGSNEERSVNVRIVCATNRNLRELENELHFRCDLLWRIKTFVLHIPPIRERVEDIWSIVDSIDKEKKFPRDYKWKMEPVMDTLSNKGSIGLEGNVREIQAIVKRYLVLKELS